MVRYASRRTTSPYARAAAHVYNNRKMYGRLARTVTRKARSAYSKRSKSRRASKVRARREFGERVGTSNCKQFNQVNAESQMKARTLYGQRVDSIPMQTQFLKERNTRSRNVINYRGVKLCIRFSSKTNVADGSRNGGKIGLNVALVVPKNDATDSTDPVNDPAQLMHGFFRSNQNNGERAMAFPGTGGVWDMLPTTTHCQPLNTDKLAVVSHMRKIITTPPGGSNAATFNPWGTDWFINKYIKVNRQLRFNAEDDTSANTYSTSPMWLLWWCDDFDNGKSNQPNYDIVNVQMDTTAYFRHTDA